MNEENPFSSENVAREWIASVEGEKGMWRDSVLYPKVRDWFAGLVNKNVVLDVGAGQGRLSIELSGYGRYIGLEPSKFLVERANELYVAGNRSFICSDVYDIPLKNDSVDAVICINVLFHLKDLVSAISEMARVLKPGGSFLINTADNDEIDLWRSYFIKPIIDDEKMMGEMSIPINNLSMNTFYFQANEKLLKILADAGLDVLDVEKGDGVDIYSGFLKIVGIKH